MKKILISDLHEVTKALEHDGYKFISHKKGIVTFMKGKESLQFALADYFDDQLKLLKPDYTNSSINIVASIRKYFGKKVEYATNPIVDELLASNQYKHISILLLDGLGSYMIRKNLAENSLLVSAKVSDISAVFPSTTACAVPALQSGHAPIKTGWLGWENYFKELNRHVVMFRNEDFYTGEKLDFNVREKLPYRNFYDDLGVHSFELGPSFYPNGCQDFSELCNRFLTEIALHEQSVSYLYWGDPDYTMHETGAYSDDAKKTISQLDELLTQLKARLPEDTLLIVTADHGHIDVNPIYFTNFTDVTNTLSEIPSNEGRAAFFKVKLFHRLKFVKNFKKYFGEYFKLLTKEQFIDEGYLGLSKRKMNPYVSSFIGDYVAIATDHYYFNFNPDCYSKVDDQLVFKSHHAGMTANEMMVPLIIIKK